MLRFCSLLGLVLVGCAQSFDAPSAFESQRYLCSVEYAAEWRQQVEACRDAWALDMSCGGTASFTGIVDGQELTVESAATWSQFANVRDSRGVIWRDEVQLLGVSPYFHFNLKFKSVGGVVEHGSPVRNLSMGVAGTDGLTDDVTEGSLRMTVGSASVELPATDGELTVWEQSADEQVVEFTTWFGQGDFVHGCMHVFPLATRTETED